jgi:glycosyltransferase involved in cell wall biosynthesis
MNTADLFVLPSLTDGNPTVMFECLGCGIPFIGTRVGGVPEVINSDDYGLLVDPGNSNDLAEKILIGLEREWDRNKILEYADQYSSEKISKQIISIYNSISKGVSS